MSFATQETPWELVGPIAARPAATAAGMELGFRYYATDTLVEYIIANLGLGPVWQAVSGPSSLVFPFTQIVYGTNSGVQSDPHFTWNPFFASLRLMDMTGVTMLVTDGTAPRTLEVHDAADVIMVRMVTTTDASRRVEQIDENGITVVGASLWNATRVWGVYFASGVEALLVDTRAASAKAIFRDLAGTPVLTVDETIAGRSVKFGAPAKFAPYTLATLPPVVDGEQIWVSDGHKVIDLGPVGTGVMAYGSLLPVAAWRVFSTDLPVA